MGIKFTIDSTGAIKALQDLKQKLEDAKHKGAAGVSLRDLLTDTFVREQTDCQNAGEFSGTVGSKSRPLKI